MLTKEQCDVCNGLAGAYMGDDGDGNPIHNPECGLCDDTNQRLLDAVKRARGE